MEPHVFTGLKYTAEFVLKALGRIEADLVPLLLLPDYMTYRTRYDSWTCVADNVVLQE